MTETKQVIIIGGGAAGLSAALTLAKMGIGCTVVEKSDRPGGYAGKYACKATEACVECGACMIPRMEKEIGQYEEIQLLTGREAISAQNKSGLEITLQDKQGKSRAVRARAVILAAGFRPFDPSALALGYGRFSGVITNLELEKMIREKGRVARAGDGQAPETMAFIQCVGSRDASLGHLWCSRVCCPSSLRMGRLAKWARADAQITYFHIDLQNCGKQARQFQDWSDTRARLVRSIPVDARETRDGLVRLSWFDPIEGQSSEEDFDMVVLSVGITPKKQTAELLAGLGGGETPLGFSQTSSQGVVTAVPGVYLAGCARTPMGIADSAADGAMAAWEVKKFLNS